MLKIRNGGRKAAAHQAFARRRGRPATRPFFAKHWRFITAILTALTTVAGLLFAGWGVWAAERALRDQQIASAWQLISIPGGGLTGKPYAIEVLVANGQALFDLDLSCKTGADDKCLSPPNLARLKAIGTFEIEGFQSQAVAEAAFSKNTSELVGVTFRHARMASARFERLVLYNVELTSTGLNTAQFRDSFVGHSYFVGADLTNASFAGSILGDLEFSGATLLGADFSSARDIGGGVNISDATICTADGLRCAVVDQRFFDAAWWYEDRPPKGIAFLKTPFRIAKPCPASTRSADAEYELQQSTACTTAIANADVEGQ